MSVSIKTYDSFSGGVWVSVVVKALRYKSGGPGSIPGDVTGFFSDISPSDLSMALGSTLPLVKINTRNIPEGKGGRCVTTSTPSRAECHENWEPKAPGTLCATPGLLRDCFIFPFTCITTQ